jgi:hypothetical protein
MRPHSQGIIVNLLNSVVRLYFIVNTIVQVGFKYFSIVAIIGLGITAVVS